MSVTLPINRWTDEQDAKSVVDRYFRVLDDREFDTERIADLFVAHGQIVRPDDSVTIGPKLIARTHAENFSKFEATQHLLTSPMVAITADRAEFRANLVAIHLWEGRTGPRLDDRAFTAGGVVTAHLDRTSDGWKIALLRNRVVWRTGHFGDMTPTRGGPTPNG